MSTTQNVDERVVEMRFDNKQFERNVQQTIKSLDKLNDSLDFDKSVKSLEPLAKATEKVSVSNLSKSLDDVKLKFSALEVVAMSALNRITNHAISAGERLVKSLSVDQLSSGWSKYEQKTASVQTLINSTGKSINEVNKYLDRLMWFSDETSYSFTDMTSALSQMTSAGGDIDKLMPMITGIANATAFAGKGAAEFGSTIRNLSQSYSAGFLQMQDMKSLNLMGTSSKQLKESFISVAESLGKIKKGQITLQNFDNTLKDRWADTEVMEKALSRFSALSDAAYEAVRAGKYDTAAEAIEALSKDYDDLSVKAFKAAQEAKSFSEAISATKDAVSSGWMNSFDIVFGDYEESKRLWTDVTNVLWNTFAAGAEARNNMLSEWKTLGGRDDLLATLKNTLNAIKSVTEPIKEAWRNLFPELTAQRLKKFTNELKELSRKFILNEAQSQKLKDAFSGLFSIVKFGADGVKTIFQFFQKLFVIVKPGVNVVLSLASALGKVVQNLTSLASSAIAKGLDGFVKFLDMLIHSDLAVFVVDGLKAGLTGILYVILSIADFISKLNIEKFFKGFKIGSLADNFKAISKFAKQAGQNIANFFTSAINEIGKNEIVQGIGAGFTWLFNKIREGFNNVAHWFDGLNEYLSKNNYLGNVVSTVVGVFKFIKDKIKNCIVNLDNTVFGQIANWMKTNLVKVTSIKDVFTNVGIIVTAACQKLGEGLQAFRNFLSNIAGEEINIKGLLKIGKAVLAIAILSQLYKLLKSFSGLGTAITSTLNTISKAIKMFGKSSIMSSMKDFGIGVALITASIAGLALLPNKMEALKAAGIIAGIVAIFVGMEAGLGVLGKKLKGFENINLIGFGVGVLGLSVSMLALTKVFEKLQETGVTWDKSKNVIAVMGSMIGILTVSGAIIGKFGAKFGAATVSLIFVVAMLNKMIPMLKSLNENNQDLGVLWESIRKIASVFVALGVLLGAIGLCGKETRYTGVALTILSLLLSLKLIIGIIEEYGKPDFLSGSERGIFRLVVIVGALTTFLGVVGKCTKEVKAGFTIATLIGVLASVEALVLIINQLAAIGDLNTIYAAIGVFVGLGTFLGLVAAFMWSVSNATKNAVNNLGLMASLLSMAAIIGVVGVVIGVLAATVTDIVPAIFAAGSLISVMFVVGKILKTIVNMKNDALRASGAIGIVSATLLAIASSIYILRNIDYRTILLNAFALSAVIGAVATAIGLLNFSTVKDKTQFLDKTNMIVTAACIAGVTVALTAFALAISLVAKSCKDAFGVTGVISTFIGILATLALMIPILPLLGKAAEGSAVGIAVVIALLATLSLVLTAIAGVIEAVGHAWKGFGEGMYAVANAVSVFGKGIEDVGVGIMVFIKSIAKCAPYVEDFREVTDAVAEAIASFLQILGTKVDPVLMPLLKLSGVFALLGVGSVVLAAGITVLAAGFGILSAALGGFSAAVQGIGKGIDMIATGITHIGNAIREVGIGINHFITYVASSKSKMQDFKMVMSSLETTMAKFLVDLTKDLDGSVGSIYQIAGAILLLGTGMVVAGTGAYLLGAGIGAIGVGLTNLGTGLATVTVGAGIFLDGIATAIDTTITKTQEAIPTLIENCGKAFQLGLLIYQKFFEGIFGIFNYNLDLLKTKIIELLCGGFMASSDGTKNVIEDDTKNAKESIETRSETIQENFTASNELIIKTIEKDNEKIGEALDAGNDIISDKTKKITKSLNAYKTAITGVPSLTDKKHKGSLIKDGDSAVDESFWDIVSKTLSGEYDIKTGASKGLDAAVNGFKGLFSVENLGIGDYKDYMEGMFESQQDVIEEATEAQQKQTEELYSGLADNIKDGTKGVSAAQEEQLTAEDMYWKELLEIKKQGADAAEYQDLTVKQFESNILQEVNNLYNIYTNKIESKRESLLSGSNLFEKMSVRRVSKQALIENLEGQVKNYQKYLEIVQNLNGRVGNGKFKDAINEMGVDSMGELSAMNQMTDTELSKYASLYEQKYSISNSAAHTQLQSFKEETEKTISELINVVGFKMEEFAEVFNGSMSGLNKYVDMKTVKEIANDTGANIVEGIASGVNNEQNEKAPVNKAISKVVYSSILHARGMYQIKSPSRVFANDVGVYIPQGIAMGVRNAAGYIDRAIASTVDNAVYIANSRQQSFFNAGRSSAEAFSLGILSKIYDVANAAALIIEAAFTSASGGSVSDIIQSSSGILQSAISKAIDAVNNGLNNCQPVITPVLDLSEVKKSAQTIDAVVSRNNAISAQNQIKRYTSASDSTDSSSSGGNTTTFIQNNYSPKALSRTEIYRNTSTQFNAACVRGEFK